MFYSLFVGILPEGVHVEWQGSEVVTRYIHGTGANNIYPSGWHGTSSFAGNPNKILCGKKGCSTKLNSLSRRRVCLFFDRSITSLIDLITDSNWENATIQFAVFY